MTNTENTDPAVLSLSRNGKLRNEAAHLPGTSRFVSAPLVSDKHGRQRNA